MKCMWLKIDRVELSFKTHNQGYLCSLISSQALIIRLRNCHCVKSDRMGTLIHRSRQGKLDISAVLRLGVPLVKQKNTAEWHTHTTHKKRAGKRDIKRCTRWPRKTRFIKHQCVISEEIAISLNERETHRYPGCGFESVSRRSAFGLSVIVSCRHRHRLILTKVNGSNCTAVYRRRRQYSSWHRRGGLLVYVRYEDTRHDKSVTISVHV